MKFSEAYNIICLKNDAKEMLSKEFSQIILRTKVKKFDTYETKQDIVFSKIKKICDVKITFPNELSFVSAGDEKLIVDGEGNVYIEKKGHVIIKKEDEFFKINTDITFYVDEGIENNYKIKGMAVCVVSSVRIRFFVENNVFEYYISPEESDLVKREFNEIF